MNGFDPRLFLSSGLGFAVAILQRSAASEVIFSETSKYV
jgi:hypothetical protein